MKKIIKITESELKRIIKRTINEMENPSAEDVSNEWYERTGDDFYLDFIHNFPTSEQFKEYLIEKYLDIENNDIDSLDGSWSSEDEAAMVEELFPNYPGDELWFDYNDKLNNAGW